MSREETALERLRVALDELVEGEAGTLVAEAHIEARARVRSLLAEAIAERMLARAEDELAELAGGASPPTLGRGRARAPDRANAPAQAPELPDPPRPAPDAAGSAPEPRAEVEHGWYVYGIVDEGFEPLQMEGVDEIHRLEVVTGAGLGALASRVPLDEFGEGSLREQLEDLPWLERNARRHELILESVRDQRATVVPMRLFTIYERRASLLEMLAREHEYLVAALERLAGRTEWGVKLYLQPWASEPDDAETEDVDSEGEAGPGESYMLRRRTADRRSEAAGQRLDGWRDQAHERLSAAATEARVNPLQPPELSEHDGTMLMNGVYLVDDDESDTFQEEVAALREEHAQRGIDVVLTGPWPPYNFVNSSEEAGV
ncbi:MAG TPA: GvpL/GvpF family gas vesicle protein [Solirubrobacteraceae bacterium]|jgi:hypothetical protein|nr:GvpL/GvpF family gas vesicle protein [Solirubrobacteraceae bacterium]